MTDARVDATILHIDLDAFFASVEQHLDPGLRGTPVVVAGLGPRGVVCAASYEARRFGVHSAMPTARARTLCPDGNFVSPRHDVYSEFSAQVMTILRDATPLVEQLSVDEAFLDVAGVRRLLGTPTEVAQQLRARIRDEAGLVASVGIATTKFLAKVASDLAKPDGLLVVEPGSELDVLHPLPVRRLWGVGPKTAAKLERFGVQTVGDVARLPLDVLVGSVGAAAGRHLHDLSHNLDPRDIVTEREAKSIGNEETFARDLTSRSDIERELVRLADSVGSRLRASGLLARTITLKARYPDFATVTRAHTSAAPTDTSSTILATARELLDQIDVGRGLRLVGVHASNLVAEPEPVQGALSFDAVDECPPVDTRRTRVEHTMDEVRRRFGRDALRAATLVDRRDDPGGPTR